MRGPGSGRSRLCADCGDPLRTHGEDGCRIPGCPCAQPVGGRQTSAEREQPPATGPELTKRCARCAADKPVGEFNFRDRQTGRRWSYCRDCDSARPRTRSRTKILTGRARNRALAELAKRHRDEFRDLLDYFLRIARDEAEQLAGTATARQAYPNAQTVRLRPGARRAGQPIEERIDVARCGECIGYHDRGHRCPACGSQPHAHPEAS